MGSCFQIVLRDLPAFVCYQNLDSWQAQLWTRAAEQGMAAATTSSAKFKPYASPSLESISAESARIRRWKRAYKLSFSWGGGPLCR